MRDEGTARASVTRSRRTARAPAIRSRRTARAPAIRSRRTARALLVLAVLGASPAHAFDYGSRPNPALQLGSDRAGRSPAHTLSFSVVRGELDTYRAVVTYPDGFRFRGFDALGPPGVEVGALMLDVNGGGTAD